ncbi:MAG: hypothetical protein PHQ64_02225 [Bacilli bacterium]|nr:hypothetical protein [Bacilli bacterium]
MRYINIDDAKPEMNVAKNIYNESSVPILTSGATLKEDYLTMLKNKGYSGFYINEEYNSDIIVEDLIPEKVKKDAIGAYNDLYNALYNFGKAKALEKSQKQNSTNNAPSAFLKQKYLVVTKAFELVTKYSKIIAQEVYYNTDFCFDLFDLKNEGDNVMAKAIAVTELSVLVSKYLNIGEPEAEELAMEAIFHDIGKLCSDIYILNAGNYSKSLQDKLGIKKEDLVPYNHQLHPYYSYALLDNAELINPISKSVILYHSEREDGTGLFNRKPTGTKADIHSSIISIADEYIDVLSGKYGEDYSNPKEAREKIMTLAGTKFNMKILEEFLNHVPPFPKGVPVVLSTGHKGVVKENTSGYSITRPVVRLENGNDLDLSRVNNITIVASLVKNKNNKVK